MIHEPRGGRVQANPPTGILSPLLKSSSTSVLLYVHTVHLTITRYQSIINCRPKAIITLPVPVAVSLHRRRVLPVVLVLSSK